MDRKGIDVSNLLVRAHQLWADQWMLLTGGDFTQDRFNCMTVAWGSLGTMWGKPFVQVVVRHSRYTLEFMEGYDTFTLSAFPNEQRKALQLLGSRSGRDGDKIAESGLTPTAATVVAAPCYAEAELVIESRKIYWQDMDAANFLDPKIEKNYPKKDYHRIYFGEIVAVTGTDSFCA